MSNLLEDDPWGNNGWSEQDGSNSGYLETSQNLSGTDSQNNELSFDESKLPQSYKAIYNSLKDQLTSGNDFENLILNKLVENNHFTGFQRTKIMNIIYDQNLLPLTQLSKFYQSLGLVGLELDLQGSGDYVTLQFKINDLPPILAKIVDLICTKQEVNDFTDPLTSEISTTNILDTEWSQPHELPVENIQLSATNNEVSDYMNSFRETFKPLYDSKEVINIKEVPEKEGLLFKHINYAITHQVSLGMNSPAGVKRVIRRYSDFVWLLEFLLKKYPFRVIPGLPPKKFTGMYI